MFSNVKALSPVSSGGRSLPVQAPKMDTRGTLHSFSSFAAVCPFFVELGKTGKYVAFYRERKIEIYLMTVAFLIDL